MLWLFHGLLNRVQYRRQARHFKVMAKEPDCAERAVSKHLDGKLGERKKCGREKCTINISSNSLERSVKQRPFSGSCERLELWEVGAESAFLYSDISGKWATTIRSFVSYIGRICPHRVWKATADALNSSWLRSKVKFPQSMRIWGAKSKAGDRPLFLLESNVSIVT